MDEIELDNYSMSFKLQFPLHTRVAAALREMDRYVRYSSVNEPERELTCTALRSELLDKLTSTGYCISNGGEDDQGLFRLLFERGGGYYIGVSYVFVIRPALKGTCYALDTGACTKIIEGKIKVKSGRRSLELHRQASCLRTAQSFPRMLSSWPRGKQ